ncbi:hypothetical protein [Phyllobacterium calauticae]|jgi:hypothetical protein|uniref:hypothetical protein n=1 Tax=Phyllobacterium calauticae TaxID=2817027 RepID=UPI001CBBEE63|nr:hypothetical protein [Phyllobacterium calauticae]MBZ3690981.1 hypothetical protein [Phyllobacterium calauticae]
MATLISLPPVPLIECDFKPVRPRDTNRMEGRKTESQTFGTPYWTMSAKFAALSDTDLGLMRAFMMQAGDDGEVFAAYDAMRPRPVLMDMGKPLSGTKAGGGAFNGDAVLQTIINALLIAVSGLPAGFQLSPGDYVEIRKSPTVRSLHLITAAATANPSGNCTFPIKYALDLQTFTLPCTVHFEKPSCTMQIDPGSWQGPKSWASREPSFSATEVFFS